MVRNVREHERPRQETSTTASSYELLRSSRPWGLSYKDVLRPKMLHRARIVFFPCKLSLIKSERLINVTFSAFYLLAGASKFRYFFVEL
jgi:hypothetical protein